MSGYTVRIERVVLHGLAHDERQAHRLSAAVAEELGRMLSDGPLPQARRETPLAGEDVLIEVPAFALESPAGERRAVHHAAQAIAAVVRGRGDA